MKKRVIFVLASLLFVGCVGVALAGCGESREDAPPMPNTPDSPDYMKGSSDKDG